MLVEHLFPGGRRIQVQHNQSGLAAAATCAAWSTGTRSSSTIDGAEGVRGADRRRGGHEGDRPAAGAGGRRHQRALPEHPGQGRRRGRTRSASRSSRARIAESDEVLYSFSAGRHGEDADAARGRRSKCVGPFKPDGPQRHAEPQEDFRLPPGERGRRAAVRARKILSTLARRAFRRPVTDADLAAPLRFYETGARATATSTAASSRRVDGDSGEPEVPVSRRTAAGRRAAPGTIYRISDLELASRLSFFLWSQRPGRRAARRSPSRASCTSRGARRAGAAHARRPALEVARHQLRVPVAERARARRDRARIRRCFPSSTTACATPSARRSSCSSTASSAKTAASSIC